MKSKKKSKKTLKKSPEKRLSITLPSSSRKGKLVSGSPKRIVKKRKLYSKEALQAAYKAVKDSSISVNAAAKQYGVPLTTLRDRVDGRISIDTTRPGPPLLMAKDEESEIAHFLHTMARYGYRYTRLELAEIATDQAVEKGKRNPRANGLTTKWVDSFINRWPSIRELSCKFKNKAEAEHTVRTYFDEIKKIIDKYKLLEKSDRIFNIMENVFVTDHGTVPSISGRNSHQVKTENTSTTTLLACGSVSGHVIAPFFVFQASKLRPEMMKGVPSNVNASVSETGKCTPQIFRRYLNEHFLPQIQRYDNEPILVLLDGSKTHVFVGMSEWGRTNGVIFSFIPAHTTHLLQPLEVGCAEALQKKYESAARRYMKSTSSPCISRSNIGELACQAYSRVITRHAVMHCFKKAGVYPDISSDESCDDMEALDDGSYKGDLCKQEDSPEIQDEVIFTEDLVVGHNQEVTEEEVVTSQEVILSEDGQTEEMVITPDGQLMLTQNGVLEGHIVIHDGEIYVNSSDIGFSHLQPLHLIHSVDDLDMTSPTKSEIGVSPLKQCIMSDGKILDTSLDMDSTLNSMENGVLSLNSSDDCGEQISIENHSVYSAMDVLGLKHDAHDSELDSSGADSEISRSSGSPGSSANVVVKHEVKQEDRGTYNSAAAAGG
ncbi:unnamed protein product [Candidula unifasciata]|uniref:HTH CENPB-type domain-containing protein n=1 Tax=Candidula unifasciata TaxID=100452 RepID=A0A8S3Z6M2_9EUPU|nr:unnamed protein product [Candidula unifasciata]